MPDPEVVVYDHPDGFTRDAWGNVVGEVDKVVEEEKVAKVVEEAEDEEEEVEWDSLSTRELRAELTDRGLSTEGVKADLVQRLLDTET